MCFLNSCVLLAVISAPMFAQASAGLEGVIFNRTTGAGIPGANVTLFNGQAVHHRAKTDERGTFQIARVEAGHYHVLIERDGFAFHPNEQLVIEHGGSIHVRYGMEMGLDLASANVRGRVLDSQGRPQSFALVELFHGSKLESTTIANDDGRFVFNEVTRGVYRIRAAPSYTKALAGGTQVPDPDGIRREDVATYFPSSVDEAGAQAVVVREDVVIKEFKLRAAPVIRVRGHVVDEFGNPSARTRVKLLPLTREPAHVVAGLNDYFVAIGEGSRQGEPEALVLTGEDGSFEFPSVHSGEWGIMAEGVPTTDSQGFTLVSSGSTPIVAQQSDIQGVRVQLVAPFSLYGSSVLWSLSWAADRLHFARRASEGTVVPIWFHAVDGGNSMLNLAIVQRDGTLGLERVPPGRFMVLPLIPFFMDHLMLGVKYYFQEPAAEFTPNSKPMHLNFEVSLNSRGPLLDIDNPVSPLALEMEATRSGSVRGTVENGNVAAVVILPDRILQGEYGLFVLCDRDGTFEAHGLAPGNYHLAAYRGLSREGLREPELLQRTMASETNLRIEIGSSAQVQLSAMPWPE